MQGGDVRGGAVAVSVRAPSGSAVVVRTARTASAGDEPTIEHVDLLGGVGDLLAERAVAALAAPVDALHVVGGRPRAARDHRQRRRPDPVSGEPDLLGLGSVAEPVVEHLDGRAIDLLAGEGRRLAWLPRPLGAQHAVAVRHGATAVRVRRHRGLVAAGTHVTARAWRAELLQAVSSRQAGSRGGTAPWARAALRLARGTTTSRAWVLVAEAHDDAGTVERCWASGDDDHRTVAELVALLAEVLSEHDLVLPPGPVAAADVLDPGPALDRLAAAGVLAWGRVPPVREAVRRWSRHGAPAPGVRGGVGGRG